MSQDARYLLVDVGATFIRFAEASQQGIDLSFDVQPIKKFAGICTAIQYFLDLNRGKNINSAALAVAGPVLADTVNLTNAGETAGKTWCFSKGDLMKEHGFSQVILVNDFEATARSLPRLLAEADAPGAHDLLKVGGGAPVDAGRIAVIGPGTGLGVAGLVQADDSKWIAIPGEGGHATMPAQNKQEAEVLELLRLRWNHVSAERLLSGQGLVNIYSALCLLQGLRVEYTSPEQITAAAFANASADIVCIGAFRLFCQMLGTMASNVALTFGANGGVFIAGGILHQFPEEFEKSEFRTRFETKGRLSSYLEAMPTYLVTHPAPALRGLYTLLFPGGAAG
jgi:glucokinase